MDHNKTALERAFELAKAGRYGSMSELQAAIKSEGYSSTQLQGPSLYRQLRQIMAESKATVAKAEGTGAVASS